MISEKHTDPESWVDLYGDYLFRYAYSRLRDANAAEEVVQETFMAGIRAQQQFNATGSERGWLLAILRRKIVDYVRKRSRQAPLQAVEEEQDLTNHLFDGNGRWKQGSMPTISPDSRLQADELWQIVRGCLQHIPAGQADAFVLSVMEEMASDEICEQLNITPSNLWVRLHRARLALARCVGSKWYEEDAPQHAQ